MFVDQKLHFSMLDQIHNTLLSALKKHNTFKRNWLNIAEMHTRNLGQGDAHTRSNASQ